MSVDSEWWTVVVYAHVHLCDCPYSIVPTVSSFPLNEIISPLLLQPNTHSNTPLKWLTELLPKYALSLTTFSPNMSPMNIQPYEQLSGLTALSFRSTHKFNTSRLNTIELIESVSKNCNSLDSLTIMLTLDSPCFFQPVWLIINLYHGCTFRHFSTCAVLLLSIFMTFIH